MKNETIILRGKMEKEIGFRGINEGWKLERIIRVIVDEYDGEFNTGIFGMRIGKVKKWYRRIR